MKPADAASSLQTWKCCVVFWINEFLQTTDIKTFSAVYKNRMIATILDVFSCPFISWNCKNTVAM